jgi:hypothetical protein
MDNAFNLLQGWQVSCWSSYFLFAVLASLFVRTVLSVIIGFEPGRSSYYCERWKDAFFGREGGGNHWSSTALGVLEALSYPVLMVTDNWSFIGAWLGFKTVAQWSVWQNKREAFNRFLIGNLLLLIISLLLLSKFVKDP